MQINAEVTIVSAIRSKMLEVYETMRKDLGAPAPTMYTYADGLFGLEFRLDTVNGPKGYPYAYYSGCIRWEKLLEKYSEMLKKEGCVFVSFRSIDAPDDYAVVAVTGAKLGSPYVIYDLTEGGDLHAGLKYLYFKYGEAFYNAFDGKTKRSMDGAVNVKQLQEYIKAAKQAETAARKEGKAQKETVRDSSLELKIEEGVLKKVTGSADTLEVPDGVHTVFTKAFSSDCKVRKVVLPDSLKTLSKNAFMYCKELEEVVLPDHLITISEGAFAGCQKLKTIQLPEGLQEIPSQCFTDCRSLEGIRLPEGLKKIGYKAFTNCFLITSVDFPDSLTSIGAGAFQCSGLESVTLPNRLKELGGEAFEGCGNKFFAACLSGTSSGIRKGFDPKKQTGISFVCIPDSVTEIQYAAFRDCELLKKVELPPRLKVIGQYAFENCVRLEEIDLPDTLAEIGDWAFYNCRALPLSTLPAGIRKLGKNVFKGCESIESIRFLGHYPEKNSENLFPKEKYTGGDVVFTGLKEGFTVSSAEGYQTQSDYCVEATCYPAERTLDDIAYMALCKSARSAEWKKRMPYLIPEDKIGEVFAAMIAFLKSGNIRMDKYVPASVEFIIQTYGARLDPEDVSTIRNLVENGRQ